MTMVLENTGPTTLTKTWYVNGTPTDVGDITVGVVDADGNTVVAAGTATTNNGDGTYDYALPIQTQVADLTITWTVTSNSQNQDHPIEVVGGWLFTEAELRAFHSNDLTDESVYSDADLNQIRSEVTDEFERICGVSFVPRYRRQTFGGDGTRMFEADRARIQSVIACTIGSTTVAASNFATEDITPFIYRTNGVFSHATSTNPVNVAISYRHGHLQVPRDIHRAALIVAHARAKKDVTGAGIPYNASSFNDGTGQYVSFSPNDQTGRWYGMGEVDSVLRDNNLRVEVF